MEGGREDGKEGGRGGGGADTELKTKTPHVNVGKKHVSKPHKIHIQTPNLILSEQTFNLIGS